MTTIITLITVTALTLAGVWWFTVKVDADFATEATLEYHCNGKDISVKITDESDIATLKQLLRGNTFGDSPSCGFDTAVSITMSNGERSRVFCPALDGCSLVRIGDSNRYIAITDEARSQLDTLFHKYGATFPCI